MQYFCKGDPPASCSYDRNICHFFSLQIKKLFLLFLFCTDLILCAICKKDYSDAFRTLAILVVCIVPGLGSGNLGGLWLMSVNEL